MTTFFLLLPLFLLGNVHCLGMCGPLVMTIGQHRYRYGYFAGRLASFSLAGMAAGEGGAVINLVLKELYVGAAFSLVFGAAMIVVGGVIFYGGGVPASRWLGDRLKGVGSRLSLLMLQDRAWPIFLFGVCTVLLPCGQTLIVFSACALAGDPWIGLGNGFALALFTTPSLWVAMHARKLASWWKGREEWVLGGSSLVIGALAVCRGLAEFEAIPHLVLLPHFVLF